MDLVSGRANSDTRVCDGGALTPMMLAVYFIKDCFCFFTQHRELSIMHAVLVMPSGRCRQRGAVCSACSTRGRQIIRRDTQPSFHVEYRLPSRVPNYCCCGISATRASLSSPTFFSDGLRAFYLERPPSGQWPIFLFLHFYTFTHRMILVALRGSCCRTGAISSYLECVHCIRMYPLIRHIYLYVQASVLCKKITWVSKVDVGIV